jgi:hypothetical protein
MTGRMMRRRNEERNRERKKTNGPSSLLKGSPSLKMTHGPAVANWANIAKTCSWHTTHAGFFYIYFITILQKYMVRYKFSKNIHLPRGPRRQGLNAAAHGGRSRQEWALSVAQTWRPTTRR